MVVGSGLSWNGRLWRCGRLFVAIDQWFQIESREVTVGNIVSAKAIKRRLNELAKALDIGFLRVGKAVGILGEDGLVAGLGFGLALRGKIGSAGGGLRGGFWSTEISARVGTVDAEWSSAG
jgi:hypothetical protein